jgi:uridine kinase
MGQLGGGGADAQVNNMLKVDLKESMDATGSTHFSGLFNVDDDSKSAVSAFKGSAKQPFVIGVAGGTASGKTTVCDMIIQQLHDHRVILVNQDSFYRGLTLEELENVGEYNFDHPDAFDTEELLSCLENMLHCQPVQIPVYDFKRHRRSSETFRKVNAADVIIMEGILVFHDSRVRDLMNMKIFVDTGSAFDVLLLHIHICEIYQSFNSFWICISTGLGYATKMFKALLLEQ